MVGPAVPCSCPQGQLTHNSHNVQGLLSQVLQLAMGSVYSPAFMPQGRLFHYAQVRDGTNSVQASDIDMSPCGSPD